MSATPLPSLPITPPQQQTSAPRSNNPQHSGTSFNFNNGNFQNAAIGDHAQQNNSGDSTQNNLSPADFRQLVRELRSLADQLSGAARTPAEQTAVAEIRQAESQARRGDRSAAFQHLRAAGQWALTIAEKLLLPIAGDAIRQSLGVE